MFCLASTGTNVEGVVLVAMGASSLGMAAGITRAPVRRTRTKRIELLLGTVVLLGLGLGKLTSTEAPTVIAVFVFFVLAAVWFVQAVRSRSRPSSPRGKRRY